MTVIAFLFHYYKHDKISNIDTAMILNINTVDGDSINSTGLQIKYILNWSVLQKA